MEEGHPVKQEKGRKISKTVSNTVEVILINFK